MCTYPGNFTLENIDPIYLIKSVKKFPQLWNANSLYYREMGRRRLAWASISRTLVPGYSYMLPNDQEEICNFISRKWRNIKDAFLKDLKNNVSKKGEMVTRSRARKRYKYAKILSFLQPVFATSLHDISLMDENRIDGLNESYIPECCYDRSDNANVSDSGPDIIAPIKIEPTKAKKRRAIKEEPLSPSEMCTATSISEEAKSLSHEVPTDPREIDQNQDKLFFDSLLPMVNDFTDRERLEFRVDILNIIRSIKNKRDD